MIEGKIWKGKMNWKGRQRPVAHRKEVLNGWKEGTKVHKKRRACQGNEGGNEKANGNNS